MPKLIAFLAKTSNAYRSASFFSICESRLARRVVPPSGLDPFVSMIAVARDVSRDWMLAVAISIVLPIEGDPRAVSELVSLGEIDQDVPPEVETGRLLRREFDRAGR